MVNKFSLYPVHVATTSWAAPGKHHPGGSHSTSIILLGLKTGHFLLSGFAQIYVVFHSEALIKALSPFCD